MHTSSTFPPSQVGMERVEILVEGLDHSEGVAYGPDGKVYASGEAGQVYRINLDTRAVSVVGSTGGWVLGLALDGDGNAYCCDPKQHALFRMTPDGVVDLYSSGTSSRPMAIPNFPTFDARG